MFRHHLVVAIRHLFRNKVYSFLNIAGLATGMACCLLILLFVQDELSYDQFHAKGDRTYRILQEIHASGKDPSYTPLTPGPLGPALSRDFPEVQQVMRKWGWGVWVRSGDKWFPEGAMLVDENLLDVFDLPLVKGERESALRSPFSVLISEEMAQKYYGDKNPLGEEIDIDREPLSGTYRITGVVDNSVNTSLGYDLFIANVPEVLRLFWDSWQERHFFETYVVLPEGYNPEELERKLPVFVEHYMGEGEGVDPVLRLQPLIRIHLYSNADYGIESWRGDNISYVYMVSLVGVFILLIACVNFINLSTSRSAKRAKEVGMRKMAGATRYQLIRQFLAESTCTVALSLVLSIGLVALLLPTFNSLSGKDLALHDGIYISALLGSLGLALLVSILSGAYPAFYISMFQPVQALKGGLKPAVKRNLFRKGMVVFQFFTSILFIIGTGVVYQQLGYIQNKELGFNGENLVVLPIFQAHMMMGQQATQSLQYEAIKREFLQHVHVLQGSAFKYRIGSQGGGRLRAVRPEGSPAQDWRMRVQEADTDYLETYGIELIDGRNFSANDVSDGFILNETAVKQLGWENPIGKRFEVASLNKKGTVIGVVRDFHGSSLREKVEPLAICVNPSTYLHLALKVRAGQMPTTLGVLKEQWDQFVPNRPFRYYYMDEWLERMYREETRLGQVLSTASLLAVFVACLGLFGLSSFTAEQKTKEIGIRKILGASVINMVKLMSNEFVILVLVSNIIAWPLAYYAMNRWLQSFAYRIDLGIGIFILAGSFALVIALVTVSYQAIKAALANPVETLRYE